MSETRTKKPSQKKKQTREAAARPKKRKRLRFAIGTALLVAAPAGGFAVGCGPDEGDMVNTPAPENINVPPDPEPESVETSNPVVPIEPMETANPTGEEPPPVVEPETEPEPETDPETEPVDDGRGTTPTHRSNPVPMVLPPPPQERTNVRPSRDEPEL